MTIDLGDSCRETESLRLAFHLTDEKKKSLFCLFPPPPLLQNNNLASQGKYVSTGDKGAAGGESLYVANHAY